MKRFEDYLSGNKLFGNDFTLDQVKAWHAEEEEGYANLGASDAEAYQYSYHSLNEYHAFRHLKADVFYDVLGFGSAYGEELLPIIHRISGITIVEPSECFTRESFHGVPTRYVKPTPEGLLPFNDNSFDLITCLGVLHHIPNVSFVVNELARVLRPGGALIIREPIISMGDWRVQRRGLTKNERGIPLPILKEIVSAAGLYIARESFSNFSLTPKVFSAFCTTYNNRLATKVDALLSKAFAWNYCYHARTAFQKLRPTSIFFTLIKTAR